MNHDACIESLGGVMSKIWSDDAETMTEDLLATHKRCVNHTVHHDALSSTGPNRRLPETKS